MAVFSEPTTRSRQQVRATFRGPSVLKRDRAERLARSVDVALDGGVIEWLDYKAVLGTC